MNCGLGLARPNSFRRMLHRGVWRGAWAAHSAWPSPAFDEQWFETQRERVQEEEHCKFVMRIPSWRMDDERSIGVTKTRP
jgi:hypothetical protein